jgi:hypothetical protein
MKSIGFNAIGRRPDYYRNPPEDALLAGNFYFNSVTKALEAG